MCAGKAIEIRNPLATRPWQHVLEPLCGYLILAERLWIDGEKAAEAWNFGPPMEDVWPVGEIVERVTTLWGNGAAWTTVGHVGGHEAGLLAVDASKAQARLKWRPRLGIETTLKWTVEWYRAEHAGEDPQRLVFDDICRFERIWNADL
jgi:CDP-glucose 4,6-dehydratase